jgi:hypothetical protein
MEIVRAQVTPDLVRALAQASGLRAGPQQIEDLVPHVQAGLDASARLEDVDLSEAEPTFFLRPSLLRRERPNAR